LLYALEGEPEQIGGVADAEGAVTDEAFDGLGGGRTGGGASVRRAVPRGVAPAHGCECGPRAAADRLDTTT
jgi:hypothetical protein